MFKTWRVKFITMPVLNQGANLLLKWFNFNPMMDKWSLAK